MKKIFKKIYFSSFQSFKKILQADLINNTKRFIITANPEIIMCAEKNECISKMLLDDNVTIVPDGISIIKVAKWLGYEPKERIAGIDVASYLIKEGNRYCKSIYLFGAQENILKSLKEHIADVYPDLKIVGCTNGFVDNKDEVFEEIKKLNPDIIFVALGVPAQEQLIYRHYNDFNKGIFVGVGGTFDVLSGSKKRAPLFFTNMYMEWLYRLIKEPKRISRFYNSNIKFVGKAFKEKNK